MRAEWRRMGFLCSQRDKLTPMPDTHVMSIQQRLLEMGETSELLTVGGDLNVLFKLAERARTLTDADFAALGTFGDDSMLNRFIYSGIDERTGAG